MSPSSSCPLEKDRGQVRPASPFGVDGVERMKGPFILVASLVHTSAAALLYISSLVLLEDSRNPSLEKDVSWAQTSFLPVLEGGEE